MAKSKRRGSATESDRARRGGPIRLSDDEQNALIDEDRRLKDGINSPNPSEWRPAIQRALSSEVSRNRQAADRGDLAAVIDALASVDRWHNGYARLAERGVAELTEDERIVPRWVLDAAKRWILEEVAAARRAREAGRSRVRGPIAEWEKRKAQDMLEFEHYTLVLASNRREESARQSRAQRTKTRPDRTGASTLKIEETQVFDHTSAELRDEPTESWIGHTSTVREERASAWLAWLADHPGAEWKPASAGTIHRSYRNVAKRLADGEAHRYFPAATSSVVSARTRPK